MLKLHEYYKANIINDSTSPRDGFYESYYPGNTFLYNLQFRFILKTSDATKGND